MARPRSLRLHALALTVCAVLGACEEPLPEGGELFARGVVGPEGGQVAGGSVTLDIPAGALTAETDIELRRSSELDLSVPGYRQSGAVVSLFPEQLQLALPAALSFDGERERPVVIFEQDSLDVVATGQTAYINEFSRAAAGVVDGDDVVPLVSFTTPTLAATPTDTDTALQEPLRMELELTAPSSFNLDVILSVYDLQGAYSRSLRGMGEGECGFRLVDVSGGSTRGDCSSGLFTATIRTAGSQVSFEIEPFLASNLDVPVAVGVIAGSSEVALQGGFFGFQTCSGDAC